MARSPDFYWGQSGKFWDEKINRNRNRNRERDQRVNRELAEAGWKVLRFWDFEVRKDLAGCIERLVQSLHQQGADATGRSPVRVDSG